MCDKGKTILLIIPNFGPGGAQRSFSQVSNHLAKTNTVVNIVFNKELPLLYCLDASVISLDVSGGGNMLNKARNFRKRVTKLKKIKKSYKVDIAISFLEGADYINVLSRLNEKVILSVRGSKIADTKISGLSGFFRKKVLIPYLYRKADCIVTVAEELRHEMCKAFRLPERKLTTIPNSYDINNIHRCAAEPLDINLQKYFHNHEVVLHVGRLHEQKEPLWMIEIFHQLQLMRSKTRLFMLGANSPDTLLHRSVLNLCRVLNLPVLCIDDIHELEDNKLENFRVILAGHQKNPYPIYCNASVFALTSSWEGFPNVLAEAMVCGCPVISTACPTGPKEILAPADEKIFEIFLSEPKKTHYGILMPVKSFDHFENVTKLWAEQLRDMLENMQETKKTAERAAHHMGIYEHTSVLNKWTDLMKANIE